MFLCYLIYNSEGRTYVGYTNNFRERIRRHNGEISGGAKYTTAHKGVNGWEPAAIVGGFHDKCLAMSFEWRMKRYLNSKGKLKPSSGLDARLKNIFDILKLDKITSKSAPPSTIPLISIVVNEKFESKLNKLVDLDDIFSGDLNVANSTLEFMPDSDIKQIDNVL